MASKKRTDVVNELATDPNPMNEEETMNESVERPLKRRLKLWQIFYPACQTVHSSSSNLPWTE